jgi:circadian clock protein KaiC
MTANVKVISEKAKSIDSVSVVRGGVEKIPTGIPGFDALLEGGISKGRAFLITGSTGTGKTVFADEFLYRGISDYDEHGVYVTFEEHPSDIIKNVRNFGWDFDILIRQKKLIFVDASPDMIPTEESGKYDLSGLVERIKYAVHKVKAKRVSVDAMSMFFSRFSNKGAIREVIYRLCSELRNLGVTSIVTAEKAGDVASSISRYGVEEYVMNGVVELYLESGQQQFIRKMFVKKIRGVGYRSGLVEYDITDKGITIFPKITINPKISRTEFKNRERFGIKGVDEAMGGGVPQGHIVLITGNTGTGKTVFGMHFIDQGIREGQNAIYIALEEPIDQVKKTAEEFGFNYPKYEKEGKLVFISPSLIDMRTDDVLNEILDAVKRINAKRIVIDSISSMISATMNEESVRQFLIQATRFFKTKGIACVMNFLSGTNFGAAKGQLLATNETSLMRLSSIVDGIILLLYVERGQRVKRILNILKMRGSWHSNEIFQYEIYEKGINFGERYEE